MKTKVAGMHGKKCARPRRRCIDTDNREPVLNEFLGVVPRAREYIRPYIRNRGHRRR